uniref:Ig-like domain-containing protein n=1 Tax=Monodelphis domestica TaxID=13616 RepID=A0A5F8GKQ6_MONDO
EFSASILLFPLSLFFSKLRTESYGDSVTQAEGHITLPEGAPFTLNCSYQASRVPYLFWYIQYPNEALKLLLRETSGKDQENNNNGFWAKKIKEKSSFHLEKNSVQMGDSAVYYCALSDTILLLGTGTPLLLVLDILI